MDTLTAPKNNTFTNPNLAVDLRGVGFRVSRHNCLWTVLSYHRGGNWLCQEPEYSTTCEFHQDEILSALTVSELSQLS